MPFCPVCKSEYRSEFTRCTDCDVDLVERLTEEPQDLEMVEAGTLPDPSFAGMVCEVMSNEGIPCALTGEEREGILPGAADPTREVGVMVPREHLKRAKEILHAYFEKEYLSEDAEFLTCSNCGCAVDEEDKVCPACGEPLED